MNTEYRVKNIIHNLIDDNPLACNAVLGMCAVEFSEEVASAAVSLGNRSSLKINPHFIDQYCVDDSDIRFVILHEFLHVVLRHTQKFRTTTPLLNVILDMVINSMLCRILGVEQCGVLFRLYKNSLGIFRLLAPPDADDVACLSTYFHYEGNATELMNIHNHLYDKYRSCYSLDDLLAIFGPLQSVSDPILLIGNHSGQSPLSSFEVMGKLEEIMEDQILPKLRMNVYMGKLLGVQVEAPPKTKREVQVTQVLFRLLSRNIARKTVSLPWEYHLPVLTASDRRSFLRSHCSPVFPNSRHYSQREDASKQVVVYVDVSGSMLSDLEEVLGILDKYHQYIQKPVYAFSTEVTIASFEAGKLRTASTGGTYLTSVYNHIEANRFKRALVLTDGLVEPINKPVPCVMEAIVTRNGETRTLERNGIRVTRLSRSKANCA